jgi:hypothetical protein
MYKYLFLLLIFVFGCDLESSNSDFFKGVHHIKKMNNVYFMYDMKPEKEFYKINSISFLWMKGEKNIVLKLPLEKIKIEVNDTIKTPLIKFRWFKGECNINNINEYISYVVIICNENDVPFTSEYVFKKDLDKILNCEETKALETKKDSIETKDSTINSSKVVNKIKI